MMKNILVISIMLIITGCTFYMPGFSGHVVDKESGSPAENAFIIESSRYYPAIEIINVGGGNTNFDPIEYSMTNTDGYFEVKPYIRLLGEVEQRVIFYIDAKHAYIGRYFQHVDAKHLLVNTFEVYRSKNPINLNKTSNVLLKLSNNPDIDNEGNLISNPVSHLINLLNIYTDENGCERRNKYLYKEINRIITNNENLYVKQFDHNYIPKWNEILGKFRSHYDKCYADTTK